MIKKKKRDIFVELITNWFINKLWINS